MVTSSCGLYHVTRLNALVSWQEKPYGPCSILCSLKKSRGLLNQTLMSQLTLMKDRQLCIF